MRLWFQSSPAGQTLLSKICYECFDFNARFTNKKTGFLKQFSITKSGGGDFNQ